MKVRRVTLEKKRPKTTRWTVFSAAGIRFLFILHNILSVWRAVKATQNDVYWFLVCGNILTVLEGLIVIKRRGGLEWTW